MLRSGTNRAARILCYIAQTVTAETGRELHYFASVFDTRATTDVLLVPAPRWMMSTLRSLRLNGSVIGLVA